MYTSTTYSDDSRCFATRLGDQPETVTACTQAYSTNESGASLGFSVRSVGQRGSCVLVHKTEIRTSYTWNVWKFSVIFTVIKTVRLDYCLLLPLTGFDGSPFGIDYDL